MTKPLSICRSCGREEGHYIGCDKSPRPNEIVINAFEPLPEEAQCGEEGCEDPVMNARSKYCTIHSTRTAHNARQYRKRKETTDE